MHTTRLITLGFLLLASSSGISQAIAPRRPGHLPAPRSVRQRPSPIRTLSLQGQRPRLAPRRDGRQLPPGARPRVQRPRRPGLLEGLLGPGRPPRPGEAAPELVPGGLRPRQPGEFPDLEGAVPGLRIPGNQQRAGGNDQAGADGLPGGICGQELPDGLLRQPPQGGQAPAGPEGGQPVEVEQASGRIDLQVAPGQVWVGVGDLDLSLSLPGLPSPAPAPGTRWIRLQVIRTANDDGNQACGVTTAAIQVQVAEANRILAPAGVQLSFDPLWDLQDRRSTVLNQDCALEQLGGHLLDPTWDPSRVSTARTHAERTRFARGFPGKLVVFYRWGTSFTWDGGRGAWLIGPSPWAQAGGGQEYVALPGQRRGMASLAEAVALHLGLIAR